jgi:hypothetical protein
MLLVAYENRIVNEPGVRLLVRSLFANVPKARLRLHFNSPDGRFAEWASQYPGLDLRPAALPAELGWNVKPVLLLEALADGEAEVTWLDADIIVTRDFLTPFRAIAPDRLIVAEEALWGNRDDRGGLRSRGWGFPTGRELPFTINSCVVRVAPVHRSLLLDWNDLLESETYRSAQTLPWRDRPIHMLSDQDVLTALLASSRFGDIPLHILRRGEGILQAFGPPGFTLVERNRVRRHGLPCFVHAQGPKPWLDPVGESMSWLRRAYRDTSPYLLCAAAIETAGAAPAWTKPRTRLGLFLRKLGFGRVWLAGMPLAALFDAARLVRSVARRVRTALR